MTGRMYGGNPIRYEMLLELIVDPGDDCIVWPYAVNDNGYGRVRFDGRSCYTHEVALASVSPAPSDRHEAAYGPCHNRLCINPRHLSWRTRFENQADRLRDGTHNRGERQGRSVLTADDVRWVRGRSDSQRGMAETLGVSISTINDVLLRRTWRHI